MHPPDHHIFTSSLAEMHRNGWFDLTAIDKMIRVSNVAVPDDTYTRFRLLHCVDFAKMSLETRSWLANEIIGLFLDPIDPESPDIPWLKA